MIPHHDLDAATNEIWERILRVNVLGTWNVIHAAAPHLRAPGDGVVLNITSLAGVRPVGSSIPYAVSKAALNHLTLLLANALGPEIRVHAVAPGLIDTPVDRELGRRTRRRCGRRHRCAGAARRRTSPTPAWRSSPSLRDRAGARRRWWGDAAMTAELTDDQRAYLTEHMWAVLATGAPDGSPQISMIGYVLDAEDRLVMSIEELHRQVEEHAASATASRSWFPTAAPTRPSTAWPSASTPTPLRAELSADVFERLSGQERPDPTSIIPTLDEQQRTVLRVTADTFLFNVVQQGADGPGGLSSQRVGEALDVADRGQRTRRAWPR